MHVIDVEVDEVEVGRLLKNLLQEDDVMGELVRTPIIEAQPLWARCHETSARYRIAAGEERHLMALADQGLGQIRDYTLSASVGARGYRFVKRGHLGDAHGACSFLLQSAPVLAPHAAMKEPPHQTLSL